MLDRAREWLEHLATPPSDGADKTGTGTGTDHTAGLDALAAAVAGHPRNVQHPRTAQTDLNERTKNPDLGAGRDTGPDRYR